MHPRQLDITIPVARALVDDQFPEWRHFPITAVDGHGTVNGIFRLGDCLVLRFPLEGVDSRIVLKQLEAESAAARKLMGRLRFASPQPVAIGRPGAGYRLPWSVQTWLPGVAATDRDPGDSVGFAQDLAALVADVRAISVEGRTFGGAGRGGELASHDAWMQTCFERSEGLVDVPPLRRMWARMRQLPRGPESDVTSHCDLMPGNLLVSSGLRLAGVLDVGGLGPADPALDLVCAWHLLNAGPRRVFREHLHVDEPQWQRGRAWAFQQAMGLIWYYERSNPTVSKIGLRTLNRLLV
ncbi:Possible phosphotransferase [Mycolicibacterium phlei]|uniref:aminoglycoside phosphotransferase family protein n=1 Tax=Mycobacteroides chelonae TaxID=1774 RepID=UPI000618CE0A|nr:aminoglycoside phosphotransferase family protein [Mycobacteroides chelonae]VEG17052.1 Possible phosphotransferase [Mycolicibacterium phlei]AKC39152.1 aminoglycoside phosphotransferase [Mycobacteroides chelonae]ANA98575.1 aminoglycoside phosphotransferase [Mycobacteroides chelonae CCUG 47445]OLT72343.1 aminoglycoside phosphotransferase [Mycobacteroides chelonae]ORV11666.1 aminoglycoside phosphotransferase [Mycobacteroides chelonae]